MSVMRMTVASAALLFSILLVPGAGGIVIAQDELASPKLRIAWDHFKPLYDRGKIVVIDVRDRGSYAAGHIPGARSIPLEDIPGEASRLKRLKLPIVVYCA